MAKYLSNKFKKLKIGIDSFSENTTSLNVTGDVKIGTGITISSTAGVITATSFARYGGTSSQFMMADGTTNSSTFLTSESDTLDAVLGRGNSSTKNLSVGIITATSFSGTASTATVAQGLTGTPSIVVNQITAQNVSVAQTLTYEDVTNVDSVGLVTARSGIHVGPTAAGVATVTTDGNASFIGVVTATTFIGNLTGNISGGISYATNAGIATVAGISTYTAEWILGADGTNNYTFTGPGLTGAENDPTIYLMRGEKYKFTNSMGAHPFRIQSTVNGSTGTIYNDGITNNDVSNGTLIWDVQFDAPSTLYYQCTSHGNMGGVIRIISFGTSTLNELSDDATPTLGGDLGLASKKISGSGNIDYTGNLKVTGIATITANINANGNIVGDNATDITGISSVIATNFYGSGANLTNLPAGNLTGTVADARISTLTASKLSGALPAISGANLTGITASGTGAIGGLTVKNESGSTVGTAGSISTIDFNGSSGVTVTASSGASGITTVVVSGGAGGADATILSMIF